MKTKLFTLLVLAVGAMFSLTSCNQEFNDEMEDFTLNLTVADSGMPQLVATLTVDGDNTKPFTIDYKIDGGSTYHLIRASTPNYISSDGKDWVEEQIDNCLPGSRIWIGLRINYQATAYFILPKLDAGQHTVEISLTNASGITHTVTSSYTM